MLIPSCISDWSENSHQESSWTELFLHLFSSMHQGSGAILLSSVDLHSFLNEQPEHSHPDRLQHASSVKDMPLESCRCQRKHKTFKDVHMTSSQQRDQGMAALQKPQLVSASRCSKYTILIQKVCFFIDSIQILHYIILDVLTNVNRNR